MTPEQLNALTTVMHCGFASVLFAVGYLSGVFSA